MEEYKVELEGVTPLLFNRFVEASIESKTKKRAGSPADMIVEDKLYKTNDGKIYTPSTHIYGMLVNATKSFKITGKGKATYSKLLGSSVEVATNQTI